MTVKFSLTINTDLSSVLNPRWSHRPCYLVFPEWSPSRSALLFASTRMESRERQGQTRSAQDLHTLWGLNKLQALPGEPLIQNMGSTVEGEEARLTFNMSHNHITCHCCDPIFFYSEYILLNSFYENMPTFILWTKLGHGSRWFSEQQNRWFYVYDRAV